MISGGLPCSTQSDSAVVKSTVGEFTAYSSPSLCRHLPSAPCEGLFVALRIIWRNVSELFGVVSALRRNASQTEAATKMAAIHKQNQIFTPIVGATLGSRKGTLVLPRRSSVLSVTPTSSQTLRHMALK